jgi:3-dehydroquinate synthase
MFDHRLEFGDAATDVAVRPGALSEAGSLLRHAIGGPLGGRVVVVTDERVAALYGADLIDGLGQAGLDVLEYRLEPGEASKRVPVADDLYRFLARNDVPRDAVVLALGGGVVSDLAGFVAATWMRGIRWAVCPTTLESAVDAAIGGKTGLNLPEAKNLVGAFHQPLLVVIDPQCLGTLDTRDVRAGLAESVKHALIASEAFLAWHEAQAEAVLALGEDSAAELILRNIRIKGRIVEQDARERTGIRVLLNFGHTIGHAIESCCAFSLRHGECVALGMVAACRLSHTMGLLDGADVTRVETILGRFGLPTALSEAIETDRIMAAVGRDKKIQGGAHQFVLLEGAGRPVVRNDIPERAIEEAYESLIGD